MVNMSKAVTSTCEEFREGTESSQTETNSLKLLEQTSRILIFWYGLNGSFHDTSEQLREGAKRINSGPSERFYPSPAKYREAAAQYIWRDHPPRTESPSLSSYSRNEVKCQSTERRGRQTADHLKTRRELSAMVETVWMGCLRQKKGIHKNDVTRPNMIRMVNRQ
jgi:hypothetical protein